MESSADRHGCSSWLGTAFPPLLSSLPAAVVSPPRHCPKPLCGHIGSVSPCPGNAPHMQPFCWTWKVPGREPWRRSSADLSGQLVARQPGNTRQWLAGHSPSSGNADPAQAFGARSAGGYSAAHSTSRSLIPHQKHTQALCPPLHKLADLARVGKHSVEGEAGPGLPHSLSPLPIAGDSPVAKLPRCCLGGPAAHARQPQTLRLQLPCAGNWSPANSFLLACLLHHAPGCQARCPAAAGLGAIAPALAPGLREQ